MNISLLVAVKNNLEYTKNFYETTRKIYPDLELCFASYGSTDDTHDYLFGLIIEDTNVHFKCFGTESTFSDTYNLALSLATKDYVAFMHNDIILTPGFCENILKHTNEQSIISYTTIEPPVFEGHNRPGKIVREFGRNVGEVNLHELYVFSERTQMLDKNKTEPGITFFMCMPRVALIEMGGLDNLFNPFFCEDDDLILRFKLKGFTLKTSLDAICYHFVSKTSRFSEQYKDITSKIEGNSNRNFIRKWGFRWSRFNKKFDIGFIVSNIDNNLLHSLEPWCSTIYIDIDPKSYIETEQPKTKFSLTEKIKDSRFPATNDIIISFDGTQLNSTSNSIIGYLQDIIFSTNKIGIFKYDIFNIEIKNLNTYENLLINKSISK